MNTARFNEFPLSFRLAQWGMLVSVVGLVFGRRLLNPKAGPVSSIAWLCLLLCLAGSMLATAYVVIRYPFLGILDAADGDLYQRQISSRSTLRALMRAVNFLAIAGLLTVTIALVWRGQLTVGQLWFCIYAWILVGFLLFLGLRFDRIKHPTVATFLRASLGLAIPLFPLFMPILFIGSWRCRVLLENADAQWPT